jgi:GxxExxY protein
MVSAMDETVFRPEHHPLSGLILGAAIEVHRHLGPGLLESIYEECLGHELGLRRLSVERQRLFPLSYKGHDLATYFRIDMIVSNSILVEIKSVERLAPVHTSQVRTYLQLSGLHTGLILNFNTPSLRDGIKRVVV